MYRPFALKGFTPQYYYYKLYETPAKGWAVGDYFKKRDDGSPGSAKCVMGHLGVRYGMTPDEDYTDEQMGFIKLFRHYLGVEVHHVNDGLDLLYNTDHHPKQRILSAINMAQELHYIEEVMMEDKRMVRVILDYLHRNPNGFDMDGYSVIKTNYTSTNTLYNH